jgi:ATP/ADP translocase
MATRNDLNTPVIALVGFISAIVFFASVIFLEVIFYQFQSQQRFADAASQPPLELTNLVQKQQARLAEYRWVDQKKGIVAIPIDRAMERVVVELSNSDRPARKEGSK